MRTAAVAAALLFTAGCPGIQVTGEPEVVVGTGEFAFEPVEDEQELLIVAGPQGGFHVWLAVQTRGLDPRNLRIDSQLYDPSEREGSDTGGEPEPAAVGEPFFFFARLFEGDEAGTWVTAGLTHQVDRGEVRGKLLELRVQATDRDGRTATGSAIVMPVRELSEEAEP